MRENIFRLISVIRSLLIWNLLRQKRNICIRPVSYTHLAPDPDADYFDSEDDEDYLADMDIGEESVSDQDTDEDISMEEDIQMDEADEK